MADMTNAIANFGWQAGQNIQNTVGNALARNEERRRYENKMTAYNQAREDQAAQQQEAAEREYGKGWATAYFTAPEDKRPLILQGGVQKAMQQGYIKPEEAGAINDGYMYRLAAETGVKFPGATAESSPYGKINPGDYTPESIGKFNQTGDYSTLVPREKSPLVQITNSPNQKGLTEEQKQLAKDRVGRYTGIQDAALLADEQNVGLTQLENMDVNTGFGEQGKAQIARVIDGLGGDGSALLNVDPAKVEAMNAVTGKLVLDVMSTQKGPQTDADQARIAKTLPNISNQALSNKFNINALKALNFRKIEMAEFYRNYLEGNNGTLKGADSAWNAYKQKTPLLSDSVKNPKTGLPMFFHEFKSGLVAKNPGATDQQVIEAWRQLTR